LEPILTRLEIEREAWLEIVQHFGSRFHRVAGQLQHMVQAAPEAGQRSTLVPREKGQRGGRLLACLLSLGAKNQTDQAV